MTEFERFANALALTESNNWSNAWGDEGRAVGRWQMHPEFFWDYSPGKPNPGETWDSWFRRCLTAFWLNKRTTYQEPGTLASIFHLGLTAWQRGDRDQHYDDRFAAAWALFTPDPAITEVS